VRRAAVDRLTVRGVLDQVAKSDPDPDVRKLALSKLTHQPVAP